MQSSSNQLSGNEDFGRFGDPDGELRSNPFEFNDELNRADAPKPPPPLQIRRDAAGQNRTASNPSFQQVTDKWSSEGNAETANRSGLAGSDKNTRERSGDTFYDNGADVASNVKRLFDEIDDIRAQNNEILRRIQRMEAKLR